MEDIINWGSSGEIVYNRTYSRPKPDGTHEIWPETVARVVGGNVGLIEKGSDFTEASQLYELIRNFAIIPAGRQLWASGVKGRQFLFNCHVSGWGDKLSDHFAFTFMRLMEGGGVGANYSAKHVCQYGDIDVAPQVHIVCDPMHRDYEALRDAGLLSDHFSSDYQGAYFEVEDSREGWAAALVELVDTAYSLGAASEVLVYDVSRVRCKGSRIKTFGGTASGPVPLAEMLHSVSQTLRDAYEWPGYLPGLAAMEIDHAIAQCVVSGGNRRSARMSIMHWNDPLIHQFIGCKADTGKHWTTNISVEVDEEFFEALAGRSGSYDAIKARVIIENVANGMLKNGEPGLWNSALSNVGEVNRVHSTNPCGEIALEEWENCNLGHINLDYFAPKVKGDRFDLTGACEAARLMTRMLIRSTWGDVTDSKQAEVLAKNRRIGVGIFGYQAMCVKMGVSFTESWHDDRVIAILSTLHMVVRDEARKYASELRIPEPIKVTTVAPTGSIAKLPGTTEGIHSIYARYFIRRIRFSTIKPEEVKQFDELVALGYEWEPDLVAANTVVVSIPTKERLVGEVEAMGYPAGLVESADEISLKDMLYVQAMVQDVWADNAVSFTVNIPEGKYTAEELATELEYFLPRLKGTTVFPDKSRPQSPYERITAAQYEALTGPKEVNESYDENCASGACPIK